MKNNKGKKNCTTGAICGSTCISRLRTCRVSKTPEIKARVIEAVLATKAVEKAAVDKERRAIEAVKAVRAKAPKAATAVKPAENKKSPVPVPVYKPSKPEAVGQQLGRGAFGSVTLNADGTVTKTYTRQVPEQSQKNEAYFQSKAAELGLSPKVISTGKNQIVMERANGVVASYFDKKTQAMIAEKTIDALKELHKIGIAHNDVHPGNVFYDTATKKVQLIDFGNSSNLSMDITFEKAFDNVRDIF